MQKPKIKTKLLLGASLVTFLALPQKTAWSQWGPIIIESQCTETILATENNQTLTIGNSSNAITCLSTAKPGSYSNLFIEVSAGSSLKKIEAGSGGIVISIHGTVGSGSGTAVELGTNVDSYATLYGTVNGDVVLGRGVLSLTSTSILNGNVTGSLYSRVHAYTGSSVTGSVYSPGSTAIIWYQTLTLSGGSGTMTVSTPIDGFTDFGGTLAINGDVITSSTVGATHPLHDINVQNGGSLSAGADLIPISKTFNAS